MRPDYPLIRSTRPLPEAERAAILADPGFGKHFTDHMAWRSGPRRLGWTGQRVVPLRAVLDAPVGGGAALRAGDLRGNEGLPALRRQHLAVPAGVERARFARSAQRLALPELPDEAFIDSIVQLVRTDQDWVPAYGDEKSLYLRPFMFASEAFLGVRPASEVTYSVIASPAGPYFPAGSPGYGSG